MEAAEKEKDGWSVLSRAGGTRGGEVNERR